MYLDTYGNEAINGWDGTQLDIDNKGQYVFAPQVGAGTKNEQNQFTGVVMGKDSGQKKIGLYGYQNGITTFGLMQDGSAFFGASTSGRINIDGTKANIYGGLTENGANSMKLTLSDMRMTGSTKAININDSKGESAFYVTYNGYMYANNVKIKGNVEATTLTATKSGKIADFTIDSTGLRGGSITCRNLVANTDGEIAGWKITGQSLKSPGASVDQPSEAGGVPTWTGTTLNSSGQIYTQKLYASGGDIAGWKINPTNLRGEITSEYASQDSETGTVEMVTGTLFTELCKGGEIKTNKVLVFSLPGASGGIGSKIGYMGLVGGDNGVSKTSNVGIYSYGGARVVASSDIAMLVSTGSIWMHGNIMAKKGFYC